jgi:hypothetical protein
MRAYLKMLDNLKGDDSNQVLAAAVHLPRAQCGKCSQQLTTFPVLPRECLMILRLSMPCSERRFGVAIKHGHQPQPIFHTCP